MRQTMEDDEYDPDDERPDIEDGSDVEQNVEDPKDRFTQIDVALPQFTEPIRTMWVGLPIGTTFFGFPEGSLVGTWEWTTNEGLSLPCLLIGGGAGNLLTGDCNSDVIPEIDLGGRFGCTPAAGSDQPSAGCSLTESEIRDLNLSGEELIINFSNGYTPLESFVYGPGDYNISFLGQIFDLNCDPEDNFRFNVPVTFESRDGDTTRQTHSLLCNTSVIPHAPLGTFGPFELVLELVASNPFPTTEDVVITAFEASTGNEAMITIDDVTAHQHKRTLDPRSSCNLKITGDDPGNTFWFSVSGSADLPSSLTYTTIDNFDENAPRVAGEAGISGSGVGLRHVTDLSRVGTSDTAFVILNSTDAEATIDVTFQATDKGAAAKQQVPPITRQLTLGPRQQTAQFFGPFFELTGGDVSGTLTAVSNASIAVLTLRTRAGFQSASLPSAFR